MAFIFKKIAIKTFEFVLIVAFAILIMNNALFIHSHKLPDGSIISHAHPFNKIKDQIPFKKHTHSSAEYIFIQHLEFLFLSLGILFLFISFANGVLVYAYGRTHHYLMVILPAQSRAPPLSL